MVDAKQKLESVEEEELQLKSKGERSFARRKEKKVELVSVESTLAVASRMKKWKVHDRGSLSDAMSREAGRRLVEIGRLEV